MDKLDDYRQIIQDIIKEYASFSYAHSDVQKHTVFDKESDRYLLMLVGWEGIRQVHGCLIHVEVIDDKIWIHRDGTEEGVAVDLLRAGVPKEMLVLGFHSPEKRKNIDFLVI